MKSLAQFYYDMTVGSFIFGKHLIKGGLTYRGYRLYNQGIRVGILIGIRLEKERNEALNITRLGDS